MGDNISAAAADATADGPPTDRPSRLADNIGLVCGIVVAAVVLAGLVVVLFAVKRGLDLTDESDYIQSEMHAGAYLRASTEFQQSGFIPHERRAYEFSRAFPKGLSVGGLSV